MKAMTAVLLWNGDRLDQPEFHRRYLLCPNEFKIELIGGIVYEAPPGTIDHSDFLGELRDLFSSYHERRFPQGRKTSHSTVRRR